MQVCQYDREAHPRFIVSPVTDLFVDPNKDVTKALSLGPPKATAMPAGVTCPANMDCTNYFCVSSAMSKNWGKARKTHSAQWVLWKKSGVCRSWSSLMYSPEYTRGDPEC